MKTIFVKDILKKVTDKKEVIRLKNVLPTLVFLGAMFFLGRAAAELYSQPEPTAGKNVEVQEEVQGQSVTGVEKVQGMVQGQEQGQAVSGVEKVQGMEQGQIQGQAVLGVEKVQEYSAGATNSVLLEKTENWGLGFGKKAGEKPTGNASIAEMKQYNAFYMAEGEEKVLYLTLDCGYENGNSSSILDALKKHEVSATFFVVGHFLESAPDIVKRMVEEGHTVGNHTYHHYDMSKISDKASFEKEMKDVETLFQQITGQSISPYYRPPQGKYSTENLKMAQELGYSTFFWSLAYVDWNVDAQPSHEEAMQKLTTRVHPGAIVLLHNTSKTNGEILDDLLTKWEKMGYTFRTLSDFTEAETLSPDTVMDFRAQTADFGFFSEKPCKPARGTL